MSDACSRALYFGKEGQTVTGRTMDWFEADLGSNIWLYPRGLMRNSSAWVQYVLDNYATVAEAVADLKKESFRMVAIKAPTGKPAGTGARLNYTERF